LSENKDFFKEVIDLINKKNFILAKDTLIKFNQKKDCHYFNTLGFVFQELGEFDAAEKNYIQSYQLNKDFLEARFNLACLFLKKNSYLESEKIFLELINKNNNDYLSYYNLGLINFEIKKYNLALDYFKKSSDIQINFYNAYHQTALTYEKLGNINEAIKNYNIAISLNTEKLNISWNNLGVIYLKSKKFDEAFKCFKEAASLNGDKSLVFNNLASTYFELGESFLGKTFLEKAAHYNKSNLKIISRLLGVFPYNNYEFNDYKFWAEEFRKNIKNLNSNLNKINFNKKKIRLAFFGADFVNHPIGYFLLDLLPEIKLNNFDVYIYSNSSFEDDLSKKLKGNLVKWEKVYELNTKQIHNLIKLDNIDILIDMSGHTNGGNLEIFANRAAPIQLSWASFLTTTGIKEIDYIIGDPHVTPLNTKEYFSEKVINLPNIWCNLAISNIPHIDTSETPAIKNGYITYGSFNNLNKINQEVINVWSDILNNSLNSRLFIKNFQLNNNFAKNILIEKFKKNNISEERLILEGSSSREDTLEKYNLIDIALDTFPWNGGTTSFELSWMCVPLLTLSGNRFVARCGESINRNLNMNDWIAYNSKDYISKALKYSNNFDLLNETRSYLRALSRKSVLFDSNAFSKGFIDCLNKIVDFYKKENN
jgi:predicted O-linked N-acetylglucosamine transferase (SPINDLY family)